MDFDFGILKSNTLNWYDQNHNCNAHETTGTEKQKEDDKREQHLKGASQKVSQVICTIIESAHVICHQVDYLTNISLTEGFLIQFQRL